MSTDKYVPSDEAVRGPFAGVLDEYCGIPLEEGVAAFDRWLAAHDARIRRDGAREALDGLANYARARGTIASMDIVYHLWGSVSSAAEHYRDTHYSIPGEAP
ncbi:hypothetical protein [Brachybacterium sp. UMB0905]|uniref:hypothetical protein n=1 Tax=Brachybacterium sp. UMB0905 TaxID=2069310 RepID=UPI000C8092FF|nr:hypothetical protein [Brachybacterium sp. UMB0905]PMC76385.1 hypothetical protein CJ197_04310 [Brachybacterium sp. UMB0905]